MFGLPPGRYRYLTRMTEPSCPGCRSRVVVIIDLQRQVADLAARVRDLEARLGRNASNSSRLDGDDFGGRPLLEFSGCRNERGHAERLGLT
jgi:hypothetical protein